MKKFDFHLAVLLKLRKQEERESLAALAAEHAKLNRIFDKKKELSRNLDLWKSRFLRKTKAGEPHNVDLPYAFIKNNSQEHLNILLREQKQIELDLNVKKKQYNEKKQKVKVLEILKENSLREWKRKYRLHKAEEVLDFIVSAKLR